MICPEHPGVTFYSGTDEAPMPDCFVCDPDPQPMWRVVSTYPITPDDGPHAAVREMVASGHWPPAEEA